MICRHCGVGIYVHVAGGWVHEEETRGVSDHYPEPETLNTKLVGEVQDMIDAVWAEGIDTETAARNIVSYFERNFIETGGA